MRSFGAQSPGDLRWHPGPPASQYGGRLNKHNFCSTCFCRARNLTWIFFGFRLTWHNVLTLGGG
jgi:hypothetical protein